MSSIILKIKASLLMGLLFINMGLSQETEEEQLEQEEKEHTFEVNLYTNNFFAYGEFLNGFTTSRAHYGSQVTDNIDIELEFDLGEFFKPFNVKINDDFHVQRFISKGSVQFNNFKIGNKRIPLKIGKQVIGIGQNITANFLMIHSGSILQRESGVLGIKFDVSELVPNLFTSMDVSVFESGENNFFRENGFAKSDWSISGGVATVINAERKIKGSDFTVKGSYAYKENSHMPSDAEHRGTLGTTYRGKNITIWLEGVRYKNNPQFFSTKTKSGGEVGFFYLPTKKLFFSGEAAHMEEKYSSLALSLWYLPFKGIKLIGEVGHLRTPKSVVSMAKELNPQTPMRENDWFFAFTLGFKIKKKGSR